MSRRKKFKFTWKLQILSILALLCMILFSAVSLILIVGMIPTIVAAIADRSKGHVQTFTVGILNFAGCLPFMMDIFHQGSDISHAIALIGSPRTIVMMYMAAAGGYLIDWSLSGVVSAIMVQNAKARLRQIDKVQADMVQKWGPEVTGTVPLDEFGFPRETHPPGEKGAA